MAKKQIKGIIPPMLTPFKANGDVDYDKHIFCQSARIFALPLPLPLVALACGSPYASLRPFSQFPAKSPLPSACTFVNIHQYEHLQVLAQGPFTP